MRNLLVCLLLAPLLTACAFTYSAKSISTTVVDDETGEPLEGVVVVAHWVLNYGLEGGFGTDMKMMETVTDYAGHFYIPAWGPERVPSGLPIEARMKGDDPAIILVKPGYTPKMVANDRPISGQAGPGLMTRISDWDGKTIHMQKFTGTPYQYGGLMETTLNGLSAGGCNFKKVPRLIAAVINVDAELQRKRVSVAIYNVEHFQSISQGKCGSVEEYLRPYLN